MPQVLIRDLDSNTVSNLKQQAINNGRSFESELRIILQDSANRYTKSSNSLFEEVRALFADRVFDDSTDLIRADRER